MNDTGLLWRGDSVWRMSHLKHLARLLCTLSPIRRTAIGFKQLLNPIISVDFKWRYFS